MDPGDAIYIFKEDENLHLQWNPLHSSLREQHGLEFRQHNRRDDENVTPGIVPDLAEIIRDADYEESFIATEDLSSTTVGGGDFETDLVEVALDIDLDDARRSGLFGALDVSEISFAEDNFTSTLGSGIVGLKPT
ncbi:hypothetical protein ACTXT7_005172 [Hymenolepis weldensis]